MLYFGAAGVIWSLDHLHRAGATAPPPDFSALMPRLLAANRKALDKYTAKPASLLLGDTGILLLWHKLALRRTWLGSS